MHSFRLKCLQSIFVYFVRKRFACALARVHVDECVFSCVCVAFSRSRMEILRVEYALSVHL